MKIKLKYKRKCPVCGKVFETTNFKKMYCCRDCSDKGYYQSKVAKKPILKKKCKSCGKIFSTTNRIKIFCSDECLQQDTKRKVQEKKPIFSKICPQCGKKFTTTYSTKKFCSRKCTAKHSNDEYYITNPRKKNNHCIKCGSPCRVKYCDNCRNEISREKRLMRNPLKKYNTICLVCGKSFIANTKNRKFCSQACSSIGTKMYMRKYYEATEDKRKEIQASPEFKKKNSSRVKAYNDAKRREFAILENEKRLQYSVDKPLDPRRGKNYANEFVDSLRVIRLSVNKCKCLNCGKEFVLSKQDSSSARRILYRRSITGQSPCPYCGTAPVGLRNVSAPEIEIQREFPEFSERNVKLSFMKGRELDLYSPELNVAIEYNGIRWHSDKFSKKTTIKDKQDAAEKNGLNLLQIWETDWHNHKKHVKNRIKALLKKNTHIDVKRLKVETMQEITQEFQTFVNSNNIRGSIDSDFFVVLKNTSNKIIGLCQFRYFEKGVYLGAKYDLKGKWQLQQYTTLLGVDIVGGLSACATMFHKKHPNINELYLLVDRLWNAGEKTCEKSGFKLIKTTSPDYSYTRFSRKEGLLDKKLFRKTELLKKHPEFSPDMTELEMAHELGYYRLYDAGKLVYRLKFKKTQGQDND